VQPIPNAYGIAKRDGNCYRDCDRHGYSDGNCYRDGNGNCHSHGDRYGYCHANGDVAAEGYSITETSSDTTAPTVRLVDRRSVISLLFGNSRANLASSCFIPLLFATTH
jgi:hypothetical protein